MMNFLMPMLKFSPHTRGCSFHIRGYMPRFEVFPAYAGMFPTKEEYTFKTVSFPRIRGDVPIS